MSISMSVRMRMGIRMLLLLLLLAALVGVVVLVVAVVLLLPTATVLAMLRMVNANITTKSPTKLARTKMPKADDDLHPLHHLCHHGHENGDVDSDAAEHDGGSNRHHTADQLNAML